MSKGSKKEPQNAPPRSATTAPIYNDPDLANITFDRTPVEIIFGDATLIEIALSLATFDPDCDEATWEGRRLAPMAQVAQGDRDWEAALKWLAVHWSSGALRGAPAHAWTTPDAVSGRTREETFIVVWDRMMTSSFDNDAPAIVALNKEADDLEKATPLLPTLHFQEPHWKAKAQSQSAPHLLQ